MFQKSIHIFIYSNIYSILLHIIIIILFSKTFKRNIFKDFKTKLPTKSTILHEKQKNKLGKKRIL